MGWTATENTSKLLVRKRDGREVPFDRSRIAAAIEKAFAAELNLDQTGIDPDARKEVDTIIDEVLQLTQHRQHGSLLSVEQVQDVVEITLMQQGHFHVARRYILYRTEHARMRALRHADSGFETQEDDAGSKNAVIQIELEPGVRVPFNTGRLRRFLQGFAQSQAAEVDCDEIIAEVVRGAFDGMKTEDVARALVLSARSRIEREPVYDQLAAQLQLAIVYRQTLGVTQLESRFEETYRDRFEHYLIEGVRGNRLDPALREYDLHRLASALCPKRDRQFRYLGIQTIFDRYLLHINNRRIETPQYFWMRVAMGLALHEPGDREAKVIEFYEALSTFRFTSATPTLFNSGTQHPQLSSCYLTTIQDDLQHIFKSIGDNAMLSKWAGGLGNDWTNVRGTGAKIRGTNGDSQGVIPFLKIVNDAAVAVNQGGKRKGAVCAYLEPWHVDFEEFLDLRKNTGDDRRRTHDMHTAAWIPDLFMQRVRDGEIWSMFSPDETPDLHDSYGEAFKERFETYERRGLAGELRSFRQMPAVELWRKLLTRLFETGHPWVTFKDPSNLRSPQDHVGVIHSSNLCTEILLNTSEHETAVCNLGSVNLGAHITEGALDHRTLRQTVSTAMRMLDNVVDINFYPTREAESSNRKHRPVGLGVMGYQDALHSIGVPVASDAALEFADRSMEAISYFAILASTELAAERGIYESYSGSKWDCGLLPIDTLELLESERGEAINVDRAQTMDWQNVRDAIAANGMRNSNCLAIAPTATISTIVGVAQSIEPTYKHLYTKSNLSGEFTQINVTLVKQLKQRGLWDAGMLDSLKHFDGSLAEIPECPNDLKSLFATAFEIDPHWLIAAAARRQKWVDQGQSLNLYLGTPNGKQIDAMYREAWTSGLKTTYYLRSLAATQVEKSTVDVNRRGIQPRWMKSRSESSEIRVDRIDGAAAAPSACSIEEPDCEACQ